MRSDAFNPYDEVVVEGAAGPVTTAVGGAPADAPRVTVIDVSPEQLRIEVGSHPAGVLVLSEIYYPGWQAKHRWARARGYPLQFHIALPATRWRRRSDPGRHDIQADDTASRYNH